MQHHYNTRSKGLPVVVIDNFSSSSSSSCSEYTSTNSENSDNEVEYIIDENSDVGEYVVVASHINQNNEKPKKDVKCCIIC